MTSTTDTAGHPDVTEISDLTEGLLSPDRSTDIQRHLEACEPCADVHASLEEIRALLGTAPAPEPMPLDVAQRIDAALAAEALLGARGEEVTTSDVSRETSTPVDRPAGRPQAATGPGRKKSGRIRRRRTIALGGVLTAAVLGAGALVLQSLGGGTSGTTAQGRPSASVSAFSGASVQNQVRDLLDARKSTQRGYSSHPRSGADTGQNTPGAPESANTLMQTQPPVPTCVRHAIPRGDQALAAKVGTYGGKSAYLVVLPDPDDSTRVTAYIVDASCIRLQPASAGKVLAEQSFARP